MSYQRRVLSAVLLWASFAATWAKEPPVAVPSSGSAVPDDRLDGGDGSWLHAEEGARPYWRRNLFKRFLADQGYLINEWWPAEVRQPLFAAPLLASLAVASTSSSSGLDFTVQRSIEQWTVGGRRAVAESFTTLGDAETGLVLLGGTLLISRWTGNDRLSRAASLSAEATLNGALYSSVLKRLTRRTRPSGDGTGAFFVERPGADQDANSFPSGHATGAFAMAAVFAGEYRDKRWVPWVAYGTAGLVAASRVAVGRHFPTDVVAGAFLGRSVGKMVLTRAGGTEPRRVRADIQPLFDPHNDGFGLTYHRSW